MEQRYDVIVVGAGPSGIAASCLAAKNGAKTLLLERESLIGGTVSQSFVSTLYGHASGYIQKSTQDLVTRAWGFSIFNPEQLIDRYYALLREHHVTVLCGHQVTSVQMQGQQIAAIQTEHRGQPNTFNSTLVIDATAGALSTLIEGSLNDHASHRYGMTALVGRVESVGGRCYSREARQLLLDRVNHAKDEKNLLESLKLCIKPTIRGDMAWLHVSVDQMDADYEACRLELFKGMAYLRNFGYGFENANVIVTSKHVDTAYPGGKHARYQLSLQDIQNGRVFSRWMASGCYSGDPVDKRQGKQEKPFCVPYESFVHPSVGNLLLCGRSIGVTEEASSFVDGIPIHHVTGEVAGTMAAWCIRHREIIERMDIHDVQCTLVRQGMDQPHGEPLGDTSYIKSYQPKPVDQHDERVIPIRSHDKEENEDLEFDLNQIERLLLSSLYGESPKKEVEPKIHPEVTTKRESKRIAPSIPFEGNELDDIIIMDDKEQEQDFFQNVQQSLDQAEQVFKERLKKQEEQKKPYVKDEQDIFIEVPSYKGLEELGIKEEEIPDEDMIMTLFIPDDQEEQQQPPKAEEKKEPEERPLSEQPRTLEIPKKSIVDRPQDTYQEKGKNVFDEHQLMENAKDNNWSEFKHLLDMLPDQLAEEDTHDR